jgi:hypothetical protein
MEKLNYLIFIGVFVIFGLYNTVNAQTVSDYEGNVYNTITIGSQIWTSENIR